MDEEGIAVLGAGSVRCMPSVAASLATYFGERPLRVKLYDADLERLDLFDRLCRTFFRFNKSTHSVESTLDFREALKEVHRVIVCVGSNCAHKAFPEELESESPDQTRRLCLAFSEWIDDSVEVLSLLGSRVKLPLPMYRAITWPAPLTPAERTSTPHAILRFLNGEDYPHQIFRDNAASPVRAWLEDPASQPLALGRRPV